MAKTKTVNQVFRKVKAPASWAGNQWQKAGIRPLVFDENAEAWVLSKEDDEDVTIQIARADGIEDVSVLDVIDEAVTDFEITSATKTEKMEVAVD